MDARHSSLLDLETSDFCVGNPTGSDTLPRVLLSSRLARRRARLPYDKSHGGFKLYAVASLWLR